MPETIKPVAPSLGLMAVGKSHGGRVIVASASLKIAGGETLCLTGPSGFGKSTLLEMMAGLQAPDQGRVVRNTPVAFMFQDDVLIPWLTAGDNLRYILPPGLPPDAARERVANWLGRFGLDGNQYPPAMSGGMRRRLSLARALASGRKTLILDEPFAFLDEAWQTAVAGEIKAQAAAGAAVVLASHTTRPLGEIDSAGLRVIPLDRSPIHLG